MDKKEIFTERELDEMLRFTTEETHILRFLIRNRILIHELMAEIEELKKEKDGWLWTEGPAK